MSDVTLWDTYEKVGREALERKDFSQAIESFRAAVAVAEKLPGEDLRLVMSLRHLSAATGKAGQLSLAHDLLGRTEEIAVTRLGDAHSETVQVKRDLYDLSRQLGHLEQAEGYLIEVLSTVRAHGETEEFLEILELLAQLAGERERFDDAAELYQQIVEARSTLYGEDHPGVAQALLWWATALSRSGRGEAAEEPLSRAYGMLERQFAEDPKSLAQSLLAGAELMSSGGRPAAALEHQKRALDLLTPLLEEGHQSLWDTREMIASSLATLGRLEESVELLEYCLKNRQARDHRTGALLKNLAGLYLSLQLIDRAEDLYHQASDLLHQTLGPEHPASLATLEERIQLYHFTGRPQEALNLALTTIRPTEQRYGAGHPSTAQVYASTAVLAHAAGKWETAYELMKASEAIWDSLTPRPLDVLSNCRLNMATCLVEMGRNAEALLALNKVTPAPGSSQESVVQDLWARLEAPTPAPEETGQRRSIKLDLPVLSSVEPESEVGSGPRTWEADPTPPLAAPEPGTERNWGALTPVAEDTPQAPDSNPFEGITVTDPDEDANLSPDIFVVGDDADFSGDDALFSEGRNFVSALAPTEPENEPVATELAEDTAASVEPDVTETFVEPEAVEQALTEIPDSEQPSSEPSPLWEEPREHSWDEGETIPNLRAPELAQNDQTNEPTVSDEQPQELPDEPASQASGDPTGEFDPQEGDDRRSSRRFNLGLNRFFDLSLRNEQGELQVIRSFLVDLSIGGLRVNTERPLPLKETFELTLPAELLKEDLQMPARVTWQQALFGASYIQGLEFQEVSDTQRTRIETILGEGVLQERGRQHYRLYRPFPIQISHHELPDWIPSYASDLSLEGVGTRLETEIRTGQMVRIRLGLEFELPTVEVGATVAWSRYGSNGVSHGLRFEEVGPVEARTIRLYIDRCLELSPD